jgi:hypothetical protein
MFKVQCLTDRVGNCASYRSRVEPFIKILPIEINNSPTSNKLWIHRSLARKESLVFDYDDGLHLVSSKLLFEPTVKRAKTVLAGCDSLADAAINAGATNVKVWRTGVDVTSYQINNHIQNNPLVWTGSRSTLLYLTGFADILAQSKQVIKIICDLEPTWQIPTIYIPWSKATQTSGLNECSIGISPLPDNDWTRCKCAFKIIQYMAAGLPVVASAVGANKEIFEQYNCQGVCARTKKEFLDGILWLQSDLEERKRMGFINRKIAEDYFDHKVLVKILAEELEI